MSVNVQDPVPSMEERGDDVNNIVPMKQIEPKDLMKKDDKTKSKFECNYCDSIFRKERNLKLHIREDHDDDDLDDKSIKFDIEVTRQKRNLNECPECGIDYHIESELERHMNLRHSGPRPLPTSEGDGGNREEEARSDDVERLLTQDDDTSGSGLMAELVEEIGFLDEIITASGMEEEGEKVNLGEVSLPAEVKDKDVEKNPDESPCNDLDQGVLEKEKSLGEKTLEEQENHEKEDVSCKTNDDITNASGMDEGGEKVNLGEVSLPAEVKDKDVEKSLDEPPCNNLDQGILEKEKSLGDKSLEEQENYENEMNENLSNQEEVENEIFPGDESTIELEGGTITMDDDAFNLLESAMEVTMATPDDSDEEDVPLSSRRNKRKLSLKVSKKERGRPSKKSKVGEEIQLDGEAVIKNFNSVADDDVVVVDERNIIERENSSSEESESEDDDPEDDDPEFTLDNGSKRRNKVISKKRVKRSNRRINKPIQITPIAKEKKIKEKGGKVKVKGRSKISVEDDIVVLDEVNIDHSEDSSSEESDFEDDDPDFSPNESARGRRKDVSDKHIRRSGRVIKKPIKKSANVDDKIIARGRTKVSVVPKEAKSALKTLPKSTQVQLVDTGKSQMGVNPKLLSQSTRKFQNSLEKFNSRKSMPQIRKEVVRCGKCNVTFESKAQLENHNKRNHYFPCRSCNKVFDMRQRLATHDKAAHQSCDVCEDEFYWPEPGHDCYYTKNNIKPVRKI